MKDGNDICSVLHNKLHSDTELLEKKKSVLWRELRVTAGSEGGSSHNNQTFVWKDQGCLVDYLVTQEGSLC